MMDSRDEIHVPEETGAQPNLPAVERLYELIDSDGVLAGIEHLITFCHEDVEMRAYAARPGARATRSVATTCCAGQTT
jgi:hypothetical protein